MNPNELTPTQSVEAHSMKMGMTHVVPKRLALELAAELERVKKERDELYESRAKLAQDYVNERDQLRAENAELLKDRKRLERLMTLERGDLLWFYQEQDKRRALDILMEDDE